MTQGPQRPQGPTTGGAATGELRVFAPGRTEIAGNHVDHQHGRVIAAAVQDGIEFRVRRDPGGRARVLSPGHATVDLDVADTAPHAAERGSSAALVRGIVAGLTRRGVRVGGFEARTASTLSAGAGLSSSAAFEVGLAHALDCLFGTGGIDPATLARIGQAAERDWYGKPCGLMDQMACALGGMQLMDFADPDAPVTERIDVDFPGLGCALFLIKTGSSHADLSERYAQIPADMRAVAALFGHEVLRELPEDEFLGGLGEVRSRLGDRATLRALHFYHEMRLVDARAAALRGGQMDRFLQLTRLSAASSAQYLQNAGVPGSSEQPVMVALALADGMLGLKGACRVHGGGFGGCVQAYVPAGIADIFAQTMDQLLGAGCARELRLSADGVVSEWI